MRSPGPSLVVLSAFSASVMALGTAELGPEHDASLGPRDRSLAFAAAAWITVLDGEPSQDRLERLAKLAERLGIERARADRLLAKSSEVARSHVPGNSWVDDLDDVLRLVAMEEG